MANKKVNLAKLMRTESSEPTEDKISTLQETPEIKTDGETGQGTESNNPNPDIPQHPDSLPDVVEPDLKPTTIQEAELKQESEDATIKERTTKRIIHDGKVINKTIGTCDVCDAENVEVAKYYANIAQCDTCWNKEEEILVTPVINPIIKQEVPEICICAHSRAKHDKVGICDEDNCDCIEYERINFEIDSDGNYILPTIVLKERIPSVLKPRKHNPILEKETLELTTQLLEIGNTIPSTDKRPAESPKYLDVDLDKMKEIRESDAGPESQYKELTEDEITLEEIAKDYGMSKSDTQIALDQMLRTAKVIQDCSITEIKDKIENLKRIRLIIDSMEQSCKMVITKKAKEETREQREARIKQENEQYEQDKKNGIVRTGKRKPRTDKTGAIKGPSVSKREQMIQRLMKGGLTREKALKLIDED